jgi:hypothetical protein
MKIASAHQLLIVLAFALAECLKPQCENVIEAQVHSPSGLLKAVIFNRECGGTVAGNTQESVLPASAALPDTGGNVFISDQQNVELYWATDKKLLIKLDPRARKFKEESTIRGVTVIYEPQTGQAPSLSLP